MAVLDGAKKSILADPGLLCAAVKAVNDQPSGYDTPPGILGQLLCATFPKIALALGQGRGALQTSIGTFASMVARTEGEERPAAPPLALCPDVTSSCPWCKGDAWAMDQEPRSVTVFTTDNEGGKATREGLEYNASCGTAGCCTTAKYGYYEHTWDNKTTLTLAASFLDQPFMRVTRWTFVSKPILEEQIALFHRGHTSYEAFSNVFNDLAFSEDDGAESGRAVGISPLHRPWHLRLFDRKLANRAFLLRQLVEDVFNGEDPTKAADFNFHGIYSSLEGLHDLILLRTPRTLQLLAEAGRGHECRGGGETPRCTPFGVDGGYKNRREICANRGAHQYIGGYMPYTTHIGCDNDRVSGSIYCAPCRDGLDQAQVARHTKDQETQEGATNQVDDRDIAHGEQGPTAGPVTLRRSRRVMQRSREQQGSGPGESKQRESLPTDKNDTETDEGTETESEDGQDGSDNDVLYVAIAIIMEKYTADKKRATMYLVLWAGGIESWAPLEDVTAGGSILLDNWEAYKGTSDYNPRRHRVVHQSRVGKEQAVRRVEGESEGAPTQLSFSTPPDEVAAIGKSPCVNHDKTSQRASAYRTNAGVAAAACGRCGHVLAISEIFGSETKLQILELFLTVICGGKTIPTEQSKTWTNAEVAAFVGFPAEGPGRLGRSRCKCSCCCPSFVYLYFDCSLCSTRGLLFFSLLPSFLNHFFLLYPSRRLWYLEHAPVAYRHCGVLALNASPPFPGALLYDDMCHFIAWLKNRLKELKDDEVLRDAGITKIIEYIVDDTRVAKAVDRLHFK